MKNSYKFIWCVSILLVLCFIIILGVDYYKYNSINNSAPFYIFIFIRILEFILPSFIIFIIGFIYKRK